MSIWQIRSIQGNVYIADQVNTRQCLYGRSGQYKVIQGNVYMADPNKFAHANTQFLSPDPMYLRIL